MPISLVTLLSLVTACDQAGHGCIPDAPDAQLDAMSRARPCGEQIPFGYGNISKLPLGLWHDEDRFPTWPADVREQINVRQLQDCACRESMLSVDGRTEAGSYRKLANCQLPVEHRRPK